MNAGNGSSWGRPPALHAAPEPTRERDELVDRVTVNVREHDRSTILLGQVFARGEALDGTESVEVLGSGNTLELNVSGGTVGDGVAYRVDITPLVEAAVKAYRA